MSVFSQFLERLMRMCVSICGCGMCAKGNSRPMSLLWFVRHPQEMVQIPLQSYVANVHLHSEVIIVKR